MYVYTKADCIARSNELLSMPFDLAYSRKQKLYYIKMGSGFDIETTSIFGEDGSAQFGFCYHWQFSFGNEIVMGRELETMVYFFEAMIELIAAMEYKGKKVRLIVFDANLGYEWQYCKKYWFYLGLSEFFCKEIRNPLKVTLGSCIEMREAIGLFGNSLSHIAKTFTKTQKMKGDLDYTVIRNSYTSMTKEEIQYCINDVRILSELSEYVYTNFFGRFMDLPLTSTGIIRNSIKRRIGGRLKFVKEDVQGSLPPENDFLAMRKYCFKGGLCGSNDFYSDETQYNVICADLTSDYPAQLLHKKFPYGTCIECDTEEFCKHPTVPYIAYVEFTNIISKTTHCIISSHKILNLKELKDKQQTLYKETTFDNGRLYKAPSVKMYINDVELTGIEKAYDYESMTVIRCWKFDEYRKAPYYITEELKTQYRTKSKLKMEHKNELPEFKDDYRKSKEFCNGIYGMCATSIFPDEKKLDGTSEVGVIVEKNAKTFEKAISGMFLSPFIAFWITAYARNILIDFISEFPDLIVQYDTDSLYFLNGLPDSAKLKEKLQKYNQRIFKLNDILFDSDPAFHDLGAWDVEKPILRFKGMGSKRYMKEYASFMDVFKMRFHDQLYSVDFIDAPNNKKLIALKHQHRKLKTVIVGCREGTFIEQFADVPEEKIFDCLQDGFLIDAAHSRKLESCFIDHESSMYITDAEGHTQRCTALSAVVLKPTSYKMNIHEDHMDFIRTMKERRYNTK